MIAPTKRHWTQLQNVNHKFYSIQKSTITNITSKISLFCVNHFNFGEKKGSMTIKWLIVYSKSFEIFRILTTPIQPMCAIEFNSNIDELITYPL